MKKKIVPLVFLAYFGFLSVVVVLLGWYWSDVRQPALQPTQPINFPHDVHAGTLGIDCAFCHKYVEKSTFASIPNTNVCMTCHVSAATDRPEVQKLIKYFEDKEPVPWKVIHMLPSHVYFSHKRHVKAGVQCSTCHGEIQVMKKVRKMRSFSMGFCVTCHETNKAPKECWTCHK